MKMSKKVLKLDLGLHQTVRKWTMHVSNGYFFAWRKKTKTSQVHFIPEI